MPLLNNLERNGSVCIQFYDERGCVTVAGKDDEFLKATYSTASDGTSGVNLLSASECQDKFPYLGMFSAEGVVHEHNDSGFINPRRLVQAQQIIAKKSGCDIVRDVVKQISRDKTNSKYPIRLHLENQHPILATKVLIATGSYTEFRNLLPQDKLPECRLDTETVVLAEVSHIDKHKMSCMPCMITKAPGPGLDYDCYILPPIRYPNGKHYLKLGHGDQFKYILKTKEDVRRWYTNPPSQHIVNTLKHMIKQRFPDVKPITFETDTCVTMQTTNKQPYIDLIDKNIGIAVGGNGYAAKSCDEIGRLAAELLVNGKWIDTDITPDQCSLICRKSVIKTLMPSKL